MFSRRLSQLALTAIKNSNGKLAKAILGARGFALPVAAELPNRLRHIGPSEQDCAVMLESLGLKSRDELVSKTVPKAIHSIERLAIDEGVSEQQALAELKAIMDKNKVFTSFIGKGYYDTITPLVILRNLIENPAWYTPYTPYQAEIAQGRLEMLLNYQTMVSDITGLPVASASLLDEGTAAAEALMMLWGRGDAKTVLLDSNLHPQTVDVIRTRARGFGWNVVVKTTAQLDAEVGQDKDVFAVVVQYPGSNGVLHDFTGMFAKAKAADIRVAVASDLMALTLLKPPGEMGADACFGSSQRFGVPMGYGGPHAAFLSTTEAFKRKMPGRIIGVSKDSRGKPALRLAMQAREQHIRREKASSNICTAQALLANVAASYGVYHGPDGLKNIAKRIHDHAVAFSETVTKIPGVKVDHSAFFDTVSVSFSGNYGLRQKVIKAALARQMNLYATPDAATLHISFDETTCSEKVQSLIDAFAEAAGIAAPQVVYAQGASRLPASHLRSSEFMTHPVFQSYHSETEMLRYLYHLQQKDLSLATAMIPLGSCTMKLNSTSEMIPITWPSVNAIHPFAPLEQTAGYTEMLQSLASWLCTVTGFDACSLQPNSGAQGEYAGLLAIQGYHRANGQSHRNVCLIPSSAHGTNPASAAMVGFDIVVVKCDDQGNVDIADLRAKATEHKSDLAAIQLTYPSTHGVFEEAVREVCTIVHENGGLVYLDGANMNAQIGLTSPGDIGADVCHLNLHKSFTIPHGGGGPGMGPICVRAHLAPFLPGHIFAGKKAVTVGVPAPVSPAPAGFKRNLFPFTPLENPVDAELEAKAPSPVEGVLLANTAASTGAVASAPYSSASILPIPWMYIRMMGATGLKEATRMAILNANYMMNRLKDHYPVLYTGTHGFCAHEFILDIRPLKAATGITEEDIAKRLMDFNFHAPTMSFPVPGTLMIEPTESESKYELDRFCDAMITIRNEVAEVESGKADKKNNVLKNAPHTADMCLSDSWSFPYSREYAAYPLPYLRERKYWPTVGRLDNVFGDRHVVCTCPPIESYQK